MADGRSRVWVWLLVGGGAFLLFVIAVFTLVYLSFNGNNEEAFGSFGDKIGVVDLEGVILSPKRSFPAGSRTIPSRPILHVNSPWAAAASEIYRPSSVL
jgi:hypothetical protein